MVCGGCANAPQTHCGPNERPSVDELIYFGTGRPGGAVSDEEWEGFLRDVVTPRFPQGLTSWPASGQWRSGDGSLTREASHVLNLVHADDHATERAIQAIVAEYKAQFRQEAVLRVKTPACVSF